MSTSHSLIGDQILLLHFDEHSPLFSGSTFWIRWTYIFWPPLTNHLIRFLFYYLNVYIKCITSNSVFESYISRWKTRFGSYDHLSADDHELYSSKNIVRFHVRKVKTSWKSSWQVLHHSFDFLDIQIHYGYTVTKFSTLKRVLALWNITFIIQSTYLSCESCLYRSTKYVLIQNPIWNRHHYNAGVLHDID